MSSAAGAGMEAECPRCKHRHGPNNKCKSCGHFGRGIIYPGPHDPHPPAAAFRLVAFDSKTQPEEESTGFLRLAQLLRNIVLIGELKMVAGQESKAASGRRTEIKEMDEHEGVSRHILGLYGDAPVSYARWRVMKTADVDGPAAGGGDGSVMVVIDRFLTLPPYRKRGYGKATFGQCLCDVLSMMEEAGVPVTRISIFIPAKQECLIAAQTVMKFGLQTAAAPGGIAVAPRPVDPTGTAKPEFYAAAGVQEFTVAASVLLDAFRGAKSSAAPGGFGAGGMGMAGAPHA